MWVGSEVGTKMFTKKSNSKLLVISKIKVTSESYWF